MNYKITKVQKYGYYTSEKIGQQWYFLVYAHVFTKDGAGYRMHFICYFDNEDLDQYINGAYYDGDPDAILRETVTKEDIRNYRDEVVFGAAESIFYGDDLQEIVDNCNYTIKRYA